MGRSSTGTLMHELDRELERLQRRAARQKRRIASSTVAWQRWSSTMDESMHVVAQLVTTAAIDIRGLSVKLSAILWTIEINESLLDATDLRRPRAFERELRQFAEQ